MSTPITRDDWLSAVKEAGIEIVKHDQDAITIKEFAAMIGVSRSRAEDRMRMLVETGVATRTRKMVLRADRSGYPVPAYRLKPKAMPSKRTR